MQDVKKVDFEGVKQLVFYQLSLLDPNLYYHGRFHTFDDVLPFCTKLAKEEGLSEEEILLVETAALFHDTGYLDQYEKNEPKGCERARKHLPEFGYSPEQIETICSCIMATQLPQSPGENILAQILCDADLGHLGTDLYFLRGEGLRLELEKVFGKEITPLQWHTGNIKFLQNHKYFTKAAHKLLVPRKEINLKLNLELIEGKKEVVEEEKKKEEETN
ncbi:hypothetical protein ABK040_004378 [Willaertia magna]